ncbi:L,D-transpeptidase [Streptomyces sp. NPDC016309]|uniref:L,D-transpeptidase n=1 Tax=Streptomyces sp. NPDC016309 TaxID=3364965 RepID=UPI0036FDDF26
MTTGGRNGLVRRAWAVWASGALCVLASAGCSQPGTGADAGGDNAPGGAVTSPAAAPGTGKPGTGKPSGAAAGTEDGAGAADHPALATARINVADGQTIGVGMPVSITFARPVPAAQRADVERALAVTTSPRTTGGWSWIKDRNLHDGQRIDYRPPAFWKPATKISVRAGGHLNRQVTVGRSLVATVDVRTHTMTVAEDGRERRVPITAGAPGMDTWNGTMVVSDKQRRVWMDSRTVDYGDAYRGYYNYAVHLTASGTYLHENPKAGANAGRRNITHGCIGLAADGTARRFFDSVIPGDVIRVVGSKETVDAGNGYGDWNLGWDQWTAGSALA